MNFRDCNAQSLQRAFVSVLSVSSVVCTCEHGICAGRTSDPVSEDLLCLALDGTIFQEYGWDFAGSIPDLFSTGRNSCRRTRMLPPFQNEGPGSRRAAPSSGAWAARVQQWGRLLSQFGDNVRDHFIAHIGGKDEAVGRHDPAPDLLRERTRHPGGQDRRDHAAQHHRGQ